MAQPIRPISPIAPVEGGELKRTQADPGVDFAQLLQQAVAQVGQYQHEARSMVEEFLRGEDRELHAVVLAAQRAELAFELFLEVRNKVVQAYQEVMRMQI